MTVLPPMLRGILIAVAVNASVFSPSLVAQSSRSTRVACAHGRVQTLRIERYSLFRPEDLRGHAFVGALSFASNARIRTRESFVRAMLALGEGDCYDEEFLAAGVRRLRAFRFISRVESDVSAPTDSTRDIALRVWDAWSTWPEVQAAVDGRPRLIGLSLTESNFLGYGVRFTFRGYDLRERRELGVGVQSENIGIGRTTASVEGGGSRTGHYDRLRVSVPFVSELPSVSWTAYQAYEDQQQRWRTGVSGTTGVLLPLTARLAGVTLARRSGSPGNLVVFGGELLLSRTTRSGATRIVLSENYNQTPLAPDSLTKSLGAQATPRSSVRLGGLLGLRQIRFEKAAGLDLVHGEQDVALGREAVVTLGRALGTLGTGPTDTYGRLDAFVGGRTGDLFAQATLTADGRVIDESYLGEDRSRWRDVELGASAQIARTDSAFLPSATVISVSGWTNRHSDRFSQGALSGLGAIRGYADETLPVGSRLVGTVEYRLNVPTLHPAIDLGTTLFADVGRGWGGDVPFGANTGWRSSVGAGLRVGFPARSGSNSRIEIAWPIEGGRMRAPVVRSYVVQLSMRR